MRSKFITKGLHLPLHLVKPTSRWFVFIQIVFPQKPECLAEWGAKHLFAFGFQRGKYAAVQFCQAERRTNSGNAAAFGEKCSDLSRRCVQLLPARQSIPPCRNVCTFICRSSIEDISRQQCAEECVTVLRHFGQCFQHWADKLSIPLFSAVQHSTDDTGVLTVCFRSLRLRDQELCICLVVFSLGKDTAQQCRERQVFFCTRLRSAKAQNIVRQVRQLVGVCPLLFEICGQIGRISTHRRKIEWHIGGWCLCQTTGVNIDLLDVEICRQSHRRAVLQAVQERFNASDDTHIGKMLIHFDLQVGFIAHLLLEQV